MSGSGNAYFLANSSSAGGHLAQHRYKSKFEELVALADRRGPSVSYEMATCWHKFKALAASQDAQTANNMTQLDGYYQAAKKALERDTIVSAAQELADLAKTIGAQIGKK